MEIYHGKQSIRVCIETSSIQVDSVVVSRGKSAENRMRSGASFPLCEFGSLRILVIVVGVEMRLAFCNVFETKNG